MNRYKLGATTDIGCERENQEDFMQYVELDEGHMLCVIADGTGSREKHPQPAAIAVMDIVEHISRIYQEEKELFLSNPEFFLRDAFLCSNKLMGAFKMGNEELYSGYAASVTAVLLADDYRIYLAHCGNTRAYVMRDGKLILLTRDHTKAEELYEDGKINLQTYYVHPDRLKMTSGIGVVIDPEIQTERGSIRPTDLVVLTTDGVHYAVQPEFMADIILGSNSCAQASANLIEAAKVQVKYPDNMTAMIIHGNPNVIS